MYFLGGGACLWKISKFGGHESETMSMSKVEMGVLSLDC